MIAIEIVQHFKRIIDLHQRNSPMPLLAVAEFLKT